MPKAVINKLISVLVMIVCMVVLYLSLGMSSTAQWGALALTLAGSLFLCKNC